MSTSITDHALPVPSWELVVAVLTLADYNTRVVVLGVTALGLACGLVGSFVLLRKRALLGDALSHATLPGIGVAFLLMTAGGGSGKWLPGLLLGAIVSGVFGVLCMLVIVHRTRIKEDAALGIVLSVFFAAGIALTGVIQSLQTGHAAGLNSFIYGKAASMLARDVWTIAAGGGLVALACGLLFKELALLCFDPHYAAAQGRPVVALDVVLMTLVVAITVIGLQAVGLILMIALLVIPPAAARFWTDRLGRMTLVAAGIGALSGAGGAMLSALAPRLPSGAIIVVVAGAAFAASFFFGGARGVVRRLLERRRLARRVARQHLLRALYELGAGEASPAGQRPEARPVAVAELLAERSWSARALRRELASAARDGLVVRAAADDAYALTPAGAESAWRVTRNHRLWELYLITHAEVAPSHVDRDADQVEHALDAGLIAQLEALLAGPYPDLASPHRLRAAGPRPAGEPA